MKPGEKTGPIHQPRDRAAAWDWNSLAAKQMQWVIVPLLGCPGEQGMICGWVFVTVRALRGLKCRQGVWEFPLVPKFWKTPRS